jgi:cytochrome bd ubiquinol oxidase subunit I
MDVVFLSRLQFAFTTAFHILFPTLTIGLAVYLVAVEALWLRTKDEMYYRMYRFWVKIFAVHFAVGVVSGITLEFEFGTNFSAFSQAVSNVFAPLLAYEGMTAFFLEAGFLGIMLFGWKRVPPIIHFLSTCLVAAGASLSAFWIMAANSWMQTPAGFDLVEGEFFVTSFREVIFNPAFPTALAHMLIASYETAAFVIAGIAAWFLLKGEHVHFFRRTLGLALVMALIFAPLQVLVGDLKGLSVAEHQPAKLAAMEGHWRTNEAGGADFILFGIPDMEAERNRFEIAVPNVLSWIVTHSADGKVQGLKEFPPEDRPNALITYWSFRIMAGIGFVFVLVAARGAWLWYRKRLFEDRRFLRTLILVQPLGFVAVVMGWITTEVGRQPWVVYGLMRTADGVSPIPAGNVVWSLTMFVLFFAFIGGTYFHYILRILRNGPDMESPIPSIQRPSGMRPLDDALRGA